MNPLCLLLCALLAAETEPEDRAQRILDGMSPEQKVGQLLMVGFGGTSMDASISRLLRELRVGAVALYSRNIRDNRQMKKLIDDVKHSMAGEVPPLVAIDQEGGNVVRVRREVMVLPGAMALGATRDPVLAYLAGQAGGIDLKLLGINTNLAPVLDVNRNPANPVINVRAFGESNTLVSRLGVPFMLGQQQAGVATVAKHFPGHGASSEDSHFDLPRIDVPWEDLWRHDLAPFRDATAAGLDAVMLAHVLVPAVDPSGTPASLSAPVIDGVLRRQMGFDGVVITDDLEMHAVADRYGVGRAAVQAVLAGADMVMVIWTAERKQQVFDALLQAVRSGEIPPARLDDSVRRILLLKARRGLLENHRAAMGKADLPNPWHRKLSLTVARRAVTLVRNENGVLPLDGDENIVLASPSGVFLSLMKKWHPRADSIQLASVPSDSARRRELEKLLGQSKGKHLLVMVVQNSYQAWLAQQFSEKSRVPLVVVSFGSPYLLKHFPRVAGYLCTYSYLPEAQQAAAEALSGRVSVTGRLPVSLGKDLPAGSGLQLKRSGPTKPKR